ncbi:MAG: tetratricopeptide repeat protein [Planctomycetota bacterium]|jgi:tetratricopeptide (TPR) repeat protein
MKRKINWKLILVIVISLVVLSITAYGLRKWNRLNRAEAGLELGTRAYENSQWGEAAQQLGKYLGVEPDDTDALMKYAQAQFNIKPLKRDGISRAINAYRRVMRIDRTHSEAAIKLIDIYIQLNMPAEAELIATQHLENVSDNTVRRMLAKALIGQRKFAEAAHHLEEIIKNAPSEILAYDILGRLSDQQPNDFPVKAEHWYNQVVQKNPSAAQAYIIRGGFYMRHANRQKAIADLKQAESYDLSDISVRLNLAREFINARLFEEAKQHLETVYHTQPDTPLLWHIWATLALEENQKEQMQQIAQNGLKHLGTDSLVFMPVAAELFIRSGHFDRASDCIDELKQKEVGPATVAFCQGLMAEQQGQWAQAVKHWRNAIQLERQSESVQLALVSALVQLGDGQSAVRQLRTFLNQNETSYSGHLTFARFLADAGNWAEAAEHARIVLQLKPDSIEGRLVYLRARMQLLAQGEMSENTQMWKNIEADLAKLPIKDTPEAKLLEVKMALLQQRLSRAEQIMTELHKNYPANIKVALAKIDVLLAGNKVDQAVDELSNIVRTFPDSITAVQYLSSLLTQQKKFADSKHILEGALERTNSPQNKRRLELMLAEIHSVSGGPETAYNFLESVAAQMPDDIPIKRRMIDYGRTIQKSENLQPLVDQIRSIEGQDGWQWRYEQARLWLTSDTFDEVYPQIVSLLKENLLSNPDDQKSRRLLAAAYERAGELQLAVSTYSEALSRLPEDIDLLVSTIAVMYKAGAYDQADSILAQAARQKLSHPLLSKLELYSYIRQGRLNPAGDILQQILAGTPEDKKSQFFLALLRMQQNRLDEAKELFNKLLRNEPDSFVLTSQLIELNLRQGKEDEALELCNKMVDRLNNASAYLLRGKTHLSLGQMQLAKEDMEKALEMEPDGVRTLMFKAQLHRSMGEIDEAVSTVRQVAALAPDNYQTQKQAAIILMASKDEQTRRRGIDFLDKALTLNPKDTELLFYKAQSLLLEGTGSSVGQAVSILTKVTNQQPEMPQAWAMLAELYLEQNEPALAMDWALQGLSHLPDDKILMLAKARCESARSPVLAIPTLKSLMEKHPDDSDVAVSLAGTYIMAGEPANAVTLLKSHLASAKSTDVAKMNIALAEAVYQSGNVEEAQKLFAQLYKKQPDNSAVILAHSRVLKKHKQWPTLITKVVNWHKGHPQDTITLRLITEGLATDQESGARETAENILRTIIDQDPQCFEALNALAILMHMSGRTSEAAELYEKVLKLDPDRTTALNNLAWILCRKQGKCEQALELVERGLKKNPDYIDLIDTGGIVNYELGQYDKAAEEFSKCIRLYSPKNRQVSGSYFNLAKTLIKQNLEIEAISNLEKALDLNIQIGGLSPADAAEARRLLDKLLEKPNYVPSTN